jgi:hypothetical protein
VAVGRHRGDLRCAGPGGEEGAQLIHGHATHRAISAIYGREDALRQDLDELTGSVLADPLPVAIGRAVRSTPTTAGGPYARAIVAPWVIGPPTS